MGGELEQVGPRLRAARRAHGWTLEEVAGRTGMSVSTLSRLEAGKRQASLELLLPLVRLMGLRLEMNWAQGLLDNEELFPSEMGASPFLAQA